MLAVRYVSHPQIPYTHCVIDLFCSRNQDTYTLGAARESAAQTRMRIEFLSATV